VDLTGESIRGIALAAEVEAEMDVLDEPIVLQEREETVVPREVPLLQEIVETARSTVAASSWSDDEWLAVNSLLEDPLAVEEGEVIVDEEEEAIMGAIRLGVDGPGGLVGTYDSVVVERPLWDENGRPIM
jgi:hypothetical protein